MSAGLRRAGRLLSVALLLASGCGRAPERVAVNGQVVFENGQPVDHGMIEFAPLESQNGAGAGAVILAGHYEIARAKGLRLGKYRVRIYQPDRETPPTGPPGAVPAHRPQEQVAAKYNTESDVLAEVTVLKDQRLDYQVQHR